MPQDSPFEALAPSPQAHPLAPYGWGLLAVALCTALDAALFKRVHETTLILVYLLGLVPVALKGHVPAALLTALLSVLAFDFFFTEPYYSFTVYDLRYLFTFFVLGLVGVVISGLTASLVQELERSRRRAEEAEALGQELSRANQALLALDSLKTTLLNNVSHELKTPLAAIEGNAELLQDEVGGALSAEQHGFVDDLLASSKRLERFIDYLVDYSRLETGAFTFALEVMDLAPLVSDTVEGLKEQVRAARLTLELRLPAEPVAAEVDPLRFQQILSNLLDNAIKFNRPGGRIDVSLEGNAQEAWLSVRDTGIGIDAAHLPHVFEKFYQVDPSSTRAFGGAGLGLAFSKALTEAQGGSLTVMSEAGRGSTFLLTLPRRSVRREAEAEGAALMDIRPLRPPG